MGVSLGLRAEVQAGMPSSSGCVTSWSQESSSTIKFSGHWADSWCALTEAPTFIGNNGNGLHNVNIMAWQTTTLVIALSGMATSEDLEKLTSFQSSDEKHKEWNKIWDVKDCSSPCWAPQYSTVRKHLFADVSRDKSSFSYLPALIQVEKQECGILPQSSYSTHRQGVTWFSPYGKWSRMSRTYWILTVQRSTIVSQKTLEQEVDQRSTVSSAPLSYWWVSHSRNQAGLWWGRQVTPCNNKYSRVSSAPSCFGVSCTLLLCQPLSWGFTQMS